MPTSPDTPYEHWLGERAQPMLRFVYGVGGLIPLAYLAGDFLFESAAPRVWPYRVAYLVFWLFMVWATFLARRPLAIRVSYPIYTLVGLAFSCVIDGWLLNRPEFIIATSLLYLIGLVIAWQGFRLTALCGLISVAVPALLLPALQVDAATVQRILLFHLIWALVASVAALSISRLNRRLYTTEAALRAAVADKEAALVSEQQLREHAEALARTDPLTGLFNRRELQREGQHAIEQSRRYGRPLALLLVDVDHFKAINDQYGHACGDAVIVAIAQICRSQLRAADTAARFGGEEFVLLLPHSTLEQAAHLAERLRAQVAAQAIEAPGAPPLQVTVSVGCAQWEPEMATLDALTQHADKALYEAKRLGRNRVVLAGAVAGA